MCKNVSKKVSLTEPKFQIKNPIRFKVFAQGERHKYIHTQMKKDQDTGHKMKLLLGTRKSNFGVNSGGFKFRSL